MRYAARKALCLLLTAAMVAVFLPESSLAASKPFEKTKPCGAMATAVGSEIAVSWEKLKGAQGYYVYESISGSKYARVATTKSLKVVRPVKTKGVTCRYVVRGYKIKSVKQTRVVNGKKQVTTVKKTALSKLSRTAYTTTPAAGKSTLKNYLRGAIMPLGHTMYIWGGGWNKADTGSGKTTRRTGLYKTWRTYAKKQSRWYNYMLHRYKINKGLDCSGFVGWTVYNVMQTRNNRPGYVYLADVEGQRYARMGLGAWTRRTRVKDHIPGDIMEGDDHIWISLGQCKDGSTVVLHASPPGVKLSGTASRTGARNSQAARLAAKYMKKYYPSWYSRYPSTTLVFAKSYNQDYNRFRWYSTVLSDPEGYRNMSADQVLADLFKEM